MDFAQHKGKLPAGFWHSKVQAYFGLFGFVGNATTDSAAGPGVLSRVSLAMCARNTILIARLFANMTV